MDFILAVSHPDHFHSVNMSQNPKHYPMLARLLGSSVAGFVQRGGAGLWYNPYVKVGDEVSRLLSPVRSEGCRKYTVCETWRLRCIHLIGYCAKSDMSRPEQKSNRRATARSHYFDGITGVVHRIF